MLERANPLELSCVLMAIPTIRTERLLLREFSPRDAPSVQALAGSREVASTTLSIPHPYEDGMAESWIEGHSAAWDDRKSLTLAIATESDGLVGAIGLHLVPKHGRAELAFWIGVPYWNRGFATEAAKGLLDYGFREIGLGRILGRHFSRNPASGRVLQKVGMIHEGTMRKHFLRWDELEDLECYAILEPEWRGRKT